MKDSLGKRDRGMPIRLQKEPLFGSRLGNPL